MEIQTSYLGMRLDHPFMAGASPLSYRVDGIKRLEKTYKFKDFASALEWTNKVGDLAEKEDHHPALLTEWGKVTVTLWTHKIGGLHRNDFIMASKTDALHGA